VGKIKITVIYDNKLHDKNLKCGWGFSCMVELEGRKIIFDVGSNAKDYLHNLDKMNIPLNKLDALVFSHKHWDHTGGLDALIGKGIKTDVYCEASFPEEFRKKFSDNKIKFHLVDKMTKIYDKVYAGPAMKGIGVKEISLTLETKDGLVIITGCAHPGIIKIIKKIKSLFGKDVYAVLGGFHLELPFGLKRIVKAFKDLGVRKAGPCHCTGHKAMELFKKEYGKDFIDIGTGVIVDL